MNDQELIYQLALTMIPKIGSITAKKLIAYVGSPEEVFKERTTNLRKIPGIGDYLSARVLLKNYIDEAEKEIKQMEKSNISCLYFQDADYPWRLKNCEDGPLLLFYKGSPAFNRMKVISIVGTRNATNYGREICDVIVSDLASKYPDLVIVSGLAYGIDITAHRKSLEYGLDTFAVLAHGLNTIYPAEHIHTAKRISEQGALLSDFHSTVLPERNNFLRRNRIIAGLSEATLVVESGQKGGALITADIASSYNREVFAIPGRVSDMYSKGCNYLIKNNIAALVESATEIEEILNWETTSDISTPYVTLTVPLTDEEKVILECITSEPGLSQEIISIRSGIPVNKLIGTLLQMELRNWVTVMPGNIYRAAVRL